MTENWAKGSEPKDLEEFLIETTKDSYKMDIFRLAICNCGSVVFHYFMDDDEGVARRVCSSCGDDHYICDSKDNLEEADLVEYECTCGSSLVNIGVGFALKADKGDIKWLYTAVRCRKCGYLSWGANWKIGYGPSLQLIDEV